jgi:hypothetical protein
MAKDPLDGFSETDLALLDAVRSLYDIIIEAGVTTHAHVDALLEVHEKRWTKKALPRAATMIALLRKLSTEPDVQNRRAVLEALKMVEPNGSA